GDSKTSSVEKRHNGSKQSKHRHRRENGDGESPTGGGGGGDDGELENFIALAPDEADIYNFSNNLINSVDNAAGGGGRGGGSENANELNPFNEFLNPRHSSHQQQQQHRRMQGKQQLPEDPWGLDLDEQLPPPEEAQPEEEEADNEVEKSKYLPSGSSLEPVNRSQQPAGGSPLMASSIDFLNSIDGGYLLSNGIIDEKGTKLIDDSGLSTLKPDGTGNDDGVDGGGGEDVSNDDIFEQMQKKAKSYRLKLYKKHKNFKHSHHHRGGYYHPMYQHHHHHYSRQKMLERERDRWKQIQEPPMTKVTNQGQVRYYQSTNKLETKEDIKAHLDGHSTSREQWPYFDKVINSLNKDQQQDHVPPFIKKYNRRTQQLIDLLEGTIAPMSEYGQRHHERKYNRRKNPLEDLFEEQRPSPNNLGLQRNYIQETIQSSTAHSNSLPGEGIHIIYDKKHMDDGHAYGHPTMAADHPYKLSSRAGQFVYHRVASPQPVGNGYGRLKRQRLPFVAITDRRLGSPPKRRPNNSISSSSSNSNSGSNNLLNHQPMP
ncbi:uncharacterized protein LOC135697213, partial [Ochlerotatus camptorhynchus]|uniref:uncharacterized protein LOC135697213 n=1 Tax=Ochlerotatus camptorhynchus TaxID=644619 RepID=UPI0031D94CF7